MAYTENAKGKMRWSSRLDRPCKDPTDLYFIETDCAERHIKIGIASNVHTRMSKMQMDCPYRLRLIKRVPGGAYLEKDLHKEFSADRITGEWFRRSEALLARIESMEGVTTAKEPGWRDVGRGLDVTNPWPIDFSNWRGPDETPIRGDAT